MWEHKAEIPQDDDQEIIFKWHWPRNVLDKRMSALELSAFILPHMPSIVGLLSNHPKIQAEFSAILHKFLTRPLNELDEVVPWIQTVIRGEEDDIIVLNLNAKYVAPQTKTWFI